MPSTEDGLAPAAGALDAAAAVPRQRLSVEQERVMADDRLIEAVRSGAITDDSEVEPLIKMLARWRREVLAEV